MNNPIGRRPFEWTLFAVLMVATGGCSFRVAGTQGTDNAVGAQPDFSTKGSADGPRADGSTVDLMIPPPDRSLPDQAAADLATPPDQGPQPPPPDLMQLPADLTAPPDLAMSPYGAPCALLCPPGLFCGMAPGGFCTKICSGPVDCPGGICGEVNGVMVCLPPCNSGTGQTCRMGYSCCAQSQPTSGEGACAVSTSNYCGH